MQRRAGGAESAATTHAKTIAPRCLLDRHISTQQAGNTDGSNTATHTAPAAAHLQAGSEEALHEEEARQPEHHRRLACCCPACQHVQALVQVSQVAAQRMQRGVAHGLPQLRHLQETGNTGNAGQSSASALAGRSARQHKAVSRQYSPRPFTAQAPT
jgi:hypothetical protein